MIENEKIGELLFDAIDRLVRRTDGFSQFMVVAILGTILGLAWVWFWTPSYDVERTIWWLEASLLSLGDGNQHITVNYLGDPESVRVRDAAHDILLIYPARRMLARSVFGGELLLLTIATGVYLVNLWRSWYPWHARKRELLSGTAMASPTEIRRLLRWRSGISRFRLAEIPLVRKTETQHIAIIGAKGSGKTVLIAHLAADIARAGDAVIIHDPTGYYLSRFHNPKRGDAILNPFDARSVRWSLSTEIRNPIEANRMAALLVPGNEGERISALRTILSVLLLDMKRRPHPTLGMFFRVLTQAPLDEFREICRGTPAWPVLRASSPSDIARMRTELGATLDWLHQFPRQEPGTERSVADWVAGLDAIKGRKPWLFITGAPDVRERLGKLGPLWLDLAALSVLSLSEGTNRRI